MKYYNKLVSLLTGGMIAFSLCGCSKNESSKESSSGIVITSGTIILPTTTKLVPTRVTTGITSTPTTTSTTTTELLTTTVMPTTIYNESDDIVLNQFNELGLDIHSSFNSSDFLDKSKVYFIYCVDFLFYDGEIKGVKYSDLSDMAKEQLISDIITIDDLICSKFPNYKETISENGSSLYSKASDIIHSGSTNVKDYSRDKLGEDNYNKVGEYKDLFVEQTSQDWEEFTGIVGDGYDKGKTKVKEWYENFKKGQ